MTPEDIPELVTMAGQTGVFKPHEIDALQEVLQDYHEVNWKYDHRVVVWHQDIQIQGFVYFAPTAMTDRTWEVWWIVVRPESQRQGYGKRLLEYVEGEVRSLNGRLLLIETSSTDAYQPTRRFYMKHGYRPVAQILDFYADGDDKVIFSKRMAP
jgi:ribosomal protein S18 acetylase RimI-like enzyme